MNEDRTGATGGAANKRILIAEDDPFISRMYQTKLTMAGYRVVLVGNGRDAYDQIKTTVPDLAMVDINMPELTGIEVLRALIDSGYDMTATKCIILTNSGNPKDRQSALAVGAEFMIKAETTPRGVLEHINTLMGTTP